MPHRLQQSRDRLEVLEATDTTTTYKVEIATEADYEYVQAMGSPEAANREIQSIMNMVEGVYEKELKLKLEIVFQHAWDNSNDPYSETDASDLLDQFAEYWNDEFYFSKDYDLAHLRTDKKDVGGIAWLGPVCRDRSSSYSLSGHQYRRSSNINIVAHEMGHSFDAIHPDEEDPPVASCDATIMQSGWDPYPELTFCQFSRNEIRSHVSSYSSCLEAESQTITLNPPSNFTATALGPHRIRLTWRNTNGANDYGLHATEKNVKRDMGISALSVPSTAGVHRRKHTAGSHL